MAGLGLLFAAASGAANGVSAAMGEEQRFNNEKALMAERARLEEEKSARIAERTRAANQKQGEEISAATRQIQNQRDAEQINAKNNSSMTAEDADVLRDKPEARKAYGLLNSNRQSDLEDRATASQNLGYLDAAKEARGEIQTEINNQRVDEGTKTANRRLDISEAHNRKMEELAARAESRRQALAESTLSFQKARATKDDSRQEAMTTREERAATAKALDGVNADIKTMQKELSNPLLDPKEAIVIKEQINGLREESKRYRAALAGAGLAGSEAEPQGKPDVEPPQNKIALLLANPDKAGDFDAKYGKGMASRYLGSNNNKSMQNPTAQSSAPEKRQSPNEMAISGLDKAMDVTARQIAAASNRGDNAEVQRLLTIFEEQKQGKLRIQK